MIFEHCKRTVKPYVGIDIHLVRLESSKEIEAPFQKIFVFMGKSGQEVNGMPDAVCPCTEDDLLSIIPVKRAFPERIYLLGNDLTGAWEIADLTCDAAALDRAGQVALLRQLLAAALRRIAGRRAAAPVAASDAGDDARVICELPGVRDAAGRSPFWDSLGHHFYDGEPWLAAERFGPAWKMHVAALLPREPLLVSFLSAPAQQALGRAAASAAIQAEVLHAAGLRAGQHVTIDDAGPVFEGDLDLVRV